MSDYFEHQLYQDEPIFTPASEPSDRLPREYREMQTLAGGLNNLYTSSSKLFYLQAKFMENFEDNYAYDGTFQCYYPTYLSMTIQQMRGYFSWRTQLRHGMLTETSLSFVFVYIYELLHGIGAASPEDGLHHLLNFWRDYREINPSIDRYLKPWVQDYVIYHRMNPALISDVSDIYLDQAVKSLTDCEKTDDEELFCAIQKFSSYHIENSRLYKTYPEQTRQTVCEVFRRMNRYCIQKRKNSYVTRLFGRRSKRPYLLFNGAVFFNYLKVEQMDYTLTPLQTYHCRDGYWTCEKYHNPLKKNKELGKLVKAVDRALRHELSVSPSLKEEQEPKYLTELITDVIHELSAAKPAELTFNLSALDGIRRSADATCQMLMTEEEGFLESDLKDSASTAASSLSPSSKIQTADSFIDSPSTDIEKTFFLSSDEQEFLRILLYGGDLTAFLRSRFLMASILADSINEKLFDTFGDTVLLFDGDIPEPIEDYIEELKGILPI